MSDPMSNERLAFIRSTCVDPMTNELADEVERLRTELAEATHVLAARTDELDDAMNGWKKA
ncbi:hypothetical protein G3I24_31075, partial [Micromonospora aurantiaca]|nr:hypothetical protein [Micromonospora aurantiaca]